MHSRTSPEDITVYDSGTSNLHTNSYVKVLLSTLVKIRKKGLQVNIANTIKQSGQDDCGLFAIAYCTSLAYGQDPSAIVYFQGGMRQHLMKC
jgi:hypothetical protein